MDDKDIVKRPADVDIKDFKPTLVPGKIQGMMNTVCYGLGTDNKLYSWDPISEEWILNKAKSSLKGK